MFSKNFPFSGLTRPWTSFADSYLRVVHHQCDQRERNKLLKLSTNDWKSVNCSHLRHSKIFKKKNLKTVTGLDCVRFRVLIPYLGTNVSCEAKWEHFVYKTYWQNLFQFSGTHAILIDLQVRMPNIFYFQSFERSLIF